MIKLINFYLVLIELYENNVFFIKKGDKRFIKK